MILHDYYTRKDLSIGYTFISNGFIRSIVFLVSTSINFTQAKLSGDREGMFKQPLIPIAHDTILVLLHYYSYTSRS